MRVLVVRFRAIGDCVMAAWPTSAIRQKYPDANITWAVERICAPVIDDVRLANRVVAFPRDQWKRERWRVRTLAEQLRYYLSLRESPYDLGIDLQGHSKTAMALRISGARRRVAVHATDSFARALNPVPIQRAPGTHWVDHHMAVLNTVEPFPQVARPLMPELPPLPEGFPAGKVVSLCTGGSSAIKQYPREHWQAVARGLEAQGCQVVTVGGPQDPPLDTPCVNYVGKLTLKESMAVIAASAGHIAPDTGTGHMAAALGVPVISLFADDPIQISTFRPYTDQGTVLTAHTPAEIDPAEIIRAAISQTKNGRL